MPVRLDPSGQAGPTRDQARRRRWRRAGYGLYVPADVDRSLPEQRIAEEAARLGPGGAVTGWASLRLHGAAYFDGLAPDGRDEVPVVLASPDRQLQWTPACVVSRAALDPADVVVRHGIRCTLPERALLDEIRRAETLEDAVVAVDMAAAAEVTSPRRMGLYVGGLPGTPGVDRARIALGWAEASSRSARESRTRMVWVREAGLPRPLCNRAVFSLDGELLGVPDLLDAEAGVAVEFDGADHLTATRRARDAVREERMRAQGLEYVTVLEPDLHDRPRLVARMRAARDRGLAKDRHRRSWTLTPPPRWPLGMPSLDDRLYLRDQRRS